jgi:hypothetical protein
MAPLNWQSKMQTIISLSTAENEVIALSKATRFVVSINYIIDELQTRGLLTIFTSKINCKAALTINLEVTKNKTTLQTNESQLNQSKRTRT